MASLALALAFFALLDGWYLVRVPCAVLRARLLQPRVRDLLAEQRYAGRVLPSDLDLLLHMNNARYLREADVARAAHLTRCGVLGALRDLSAHSVLAASCARYRRSLRLFEPFEVHTRLLGWDDRAFYLEARFVSLRDGFVCSLLRFRQHVLGTSPDRVVQHLCKRRVSIPTPMPQPSREEDSFEVLGLVLCWNTFALFFCVHGVALLGVPSIYEPRLYSSGLDSFESALNHRVSPVSLPS